jgi:FixJ family two-component response regulator
MREDLLGNSQTLNLLDARHEVDGPRSLARIKHWQIGALPSAYLVEDDFMVRRATAAILREIGFEVHPYESGVELIRNIAKEIATVHFLFSDFHMPELTGYCLSQEVRKRWPDAKILLMSGASETSLFGELMPADWPHFIPKPFTYQALVRKLEELFGKIWVGT